MRTTQKIAASILATTFLGASVAPTLAAQNQADGKPAAEKKMAHAGKNKHSKNKHGKKGNRGMKRAFERFDANKDGVITQEEVDAVIVERFNSVAGGDTTITLEEFRAGWLDKSRDHMVRGFQKLDSDGDGAITADEITTASDRMFNRLDRDGNGELTRPAPKDKADAGAKNDQHKKAERGGKHRHGGKRTAMLMERFDVDKDGKITRAEFDEIRGNLFSGADADGNSTISIEEFVTVWQEMNSDRITRSFQKLDADGDLSVTQEEYAARSGNFVKKHDRNGDGVVTKADKKRGKHHGKKTERSMKKPAHKPAPDKASLKTPAKPAPAKTQDI